MERMVKLVVLIAALSMVSCTGFIQIGSRPGKNVYVTDAAPASAASSNESNCALYRPPQRSELPALPEYNEHNTDEEIIDSLSREILKLRKFHREEGDRWDRHYQDYLEQCRHPQ